MCRLDAPISEDSVVSMNPNRPNDNRKFSKDSQRFWYRPSHIFEYT